MSSILVTNIDDKVSEFHLRELFEAFGAIEKVTMAQTQVGPQCTIQYAAAEDARKALFFTGTNLGSRAIIVTPIAVKPPPIPLTGRGPTLAMSQAQITAASQGMTPEQQLESILGTAHSSAEQVARTVYLGNLAKAATEEDVARHFQTCGPIVYIKMGGIDAKSSVSRDNKFAFIEFLNIEGAAMAKNKSSTVFMGRQIVVGASNNPIVRPQDIKVAVKVEERVSSALQKVKDAQAALAKKLAQESNESKKSDGEEKNDKKKSKKSRSRSRSRSRGRRSRRSRSRSRDRSRERRREQRSRDGSDRDRTPGLRAKGPRPASRERSPRPMTQRELEDEARRLKKLAKKSIDRTNMFFDGYSWQPILAVPGVVPVVNLAHLGVKKVHPVFPGQEL